MLRRQDSKRRGNAMVIFALVAFTMFGVAGLAIDMGYVWLTRRQMQTAVDAAAREGMRFRDNIPQPLIDNLQADNDFMATVGPPPATPQTLTDPSWTLWRENARRWLVRMQIVATYADAMDVATGNKIQYGAGPAFDVTGGMGDANAFQTLTPAAQGVVYKPDVQLNVNNVTEGDMVALNSGPNANFPAGAVGNETDDYQQRDFTVAGKDTAADSFLVRLRRTNDPQGNVRNPVDVQPGISTSGNALPLIFARGSLITSPNPAPRDSARHVGIPVRATAIASGKPAASVGLPNADHLLMGVTPFALDNLALWNVEAFAKAPVTATFDATGKIIVTTSGFGAGPHGRFLANSPTVLGQPVPPAAPLTAQNITGFVPIYQSVANASNTTVDRVVGFGMVIMTPTGNVNEVQLTMLPSQIAPENVSATLTAQVVLDGAESTAVWSAFKALQAPVLAPALVR